MFGHWVQERQLHSLGGLSRPKVLRNRSSPKQGRNSQLRWTGQVQEKKMELEILTSPKGRLRGKYTWETLEKPQIDERLKKQEKRAKLRDCAFCDHKALEGSLLWCLFRRTDHVVVSVLEKTFYFVFIHWLFSVVGLWYLSASGLDLFRWPVTSWNNASQRERVQYIGPHS